MIFEYWVIVFAGVVLIWAMVKHERTLRNLEAKLLGDDTDD